MKKHKIKALIIAAMILMAIVAGCGRNGNNDDPAAGATPEPAADATPAPAADETGAGDTVTPAADRPFFEFEFYANYDWYDTSPVWGEDAVSAYMRDRFNIGMRITNPDIDPAQMMGIMITAGDLPDVMMIERDAIFHQLIELDMLLPLNDFLPGSYYEQILDASTINMTRVNGNVYGLLNWATSEPTGNGGWMVNRDIWESLGSPPLDTTDQMTDFLIAVRDAEITVDGMPVVPMQFGPGAINYFALSSFGVSYVHGIASVDGALQLYMTAPGAEDAFLWLNRMWNEGLINPDHFVETPEQISEKLAVGRVAVYAGHDVTAHFATNIRPTFLANNPGNDFVVIPPPAAPGVSRDQIWTSSWFSLGWNIVVITRNAQNPERIFELLDFIHSDEGARLTRVGPQGMLWDVECERGFPILTRSLEDLSAAERDAYGVNLMWTKLGNTAYFNNAQAVENDRLAPEDRDWGASAQINIVWPYSMNADAFINLHPNPQEPAGIARGTFVDLNERHIPRIVTAANEAAARTALQEAIDEIYGQGFAMVEEHKTAIYLENLARMR